MPCVSVLPRYRITKQIALVGFLAVLGLSSVSTAGNELSSASDGSAESLGKDKESEANQGNMMVTPKKTNKSSEPELTGLIQTPAGRRSARLAKKEE